MVAEKEAHKQNIREKAENEIKQLNYDLKKTNQQIKSLRQEKVNTDLVYLFLCTDTYFLFLFSDN